MPHIWLHNQEMKNGNESNTLGILVSCQINSGYQNRSDDFKMASFELFSKVRQFFCESSNGAIEFDTRYLSMHNIL